MIRRPATALLIAAMASTAAPDRAQAQTAGVNALLQQGRYWQARGRADLARAAYRRVLAIDSANAEARRALAGPAPARPAAAAPSSAPAPVRTVRPTPAAARRSATPPATPVRRAPTPARETGGDARAGGFRALDGGDLVQADRLFTNALASNRNDADATGGLGLVRLRQSRFEEATDLLSRASTRGNAARWAEALASARFYGGLDAARAKLASGDVAGAQADAETLARGPVKERGPALALLADVYERQGRYADAADLARQAGSAAGSEAQLQSRVVRDEALQAAARGDTVQADQQFQRGLLLAETDPWIRYEYARYLIAGGRTPEADAMIQSLQTIGSADALYAAAMLHNQVGRQPQAQSLLGRLTEAQRTPAIRRFEAQMAVDAAIVRARAIAAQGRTAEATGALRQIGTTPGLGAASLATIAGALDELGDPMGAAPLVDRALSAGPTSASDYEPIVRILARTGQDAALNATIDRARATAGGSADGTLVVGRLQGIAAASQADRLRSAGQNAQAFDLLQQAWAGAPGNSDILAALGRLYQSGSLNAQAAQTYQMVLATQPRDKGALTGLIASAGAAGDHDLAVATVDRALVAYPDDYEIYAAAGQMEQARGNRGAALRYLRRAEASYNARSGGGTRIDGANPFGSGMAATNPFRQTAPAPAPMLNPFALSSSRTAITPAPNAGGAMRFSTAPAYAGTPATGTAAAYGIPDQAIPAAGGDPVLARLRGDIAALTTDRGPRAELKTGYRPRSGETGLSELRELSGTARVSTGFAGGRVSLSASPVVIDAGRPDGSALARFGRNATSEAQGIVAKLPSVLTQAETQHASGVAVGASYDSSALRVEIGTTPLGFEDTEVVGGITVKPRFSPNFSGQAWVRREAVTDSVVSYAGTRDPVSGRFNGGNGDRWGQVLRSGGGASLSWDKDGTGIYGDASAYRYRGVNVRNNTGYQANVGGYLAVYRDGNSTLTGGLNLNWQSYDNNQNYFTYGHGGYFSPQSFLSMSLPLRYNYTSSKWEGQLGAAPGYQSYEQDRAPIYPTDPAAQATLDALKAQNADVRSYYDSLSSTGFAFSADGSVFYKVRPNTRIGASASVNTFGTYDEYRSSIELRQTLGTGK
ncbi:cellulose biosynthesis protein BcsC [Sphingomonas hylomeconis]|uniref:Cellulose synthase subunit BcsC-related outer membrane protein n=1 Tax=Sphingomonas hylomeconis TaxID=1395958 RepID=A0ABV7SZ27_9SPHN|nr:cellulose biosynthesis protein BcsC [Sphingomonas hylomeconis]